MFDLIAAIFAPLIQAIVSLFAAILTPILAPIFEVIAYIIGAILHFILALIANLLGAGWMAAHSSGLKRLGYLLIALTSAHLLAGIVLPITGAAPAALLSWAFAPLVMLASFVLLIIGAILVMAASLNGKEPTRRSAAQGPNRSPIVTTEPLSIGLAKDLVTHGMAIVFIAVVFIGVFAFSSAQSERQSLRERLCDGARVKYEETVSEGWRARISRAVKLGEDKLGPELSAKLRERHPCPKPE